MLYDTLCPRPEPDVYFTHDFGITFTRYCSYRYRFFLLYNLALITTNFLIK
jgi:hypothetical protein